MLLGSIYAGVHPADAGRADNSDYGRELRLASEAKPAGDAFLAQGLDASRLYHLDTPITLQLYLATYRPFITRNPLENILDNATEPVDVALGKTSIYDLQLLQRYPNTARLFCWPEDESLKPVFRVYRIAR